VQVEHQLFFFTMFLILLFCHGFCFPSMVEEQNPNKIREREEKIKEKRAFLEEEEKKRNTDLKNKRKTYIAVEVVRLLPLGFCWIH